VTSAGNYGVGIKVSPATSAEITAETTSPKIDHVRIGERHGSIKGAPASTSSPIKSSPAIA
jgi:hypothetical protein